MKPYLRNFTLLMIITGHAFADSEQLPNSRVTAKLSDIDKVQSAQSHRVGTSEGAQLISQEYIQAQQASTLADALRKTTSVQVDEESGQQGNLVFVRGFTQDQISVRVEGAPKNFNQVRHGGAGTIWLEPDMYKSITAIPGVASSVYGNGSLGGVILLETKDPEDIIDEQKGWGINLRGGMESNAESHYTSLSAAKKLSDQWAVSTTYVYRDTNQYKDGRGNKALLGSTGTEDNNILLKTVYTSPSKEKRIELSYIGLRKNYTARTTVGSGAYTAPSKTEVDDDNYSVQYGWNPADNQYLDLNLRLSRAETERWRLRQGDTVSSIWGVKTNYLEIENVSTFFQTDDITHQLRFGTDYTFDDVRTAYSNLDAERTQYGAYLSNTMSYGENLELVASARYDRFENDVDGARSIDETAFSPKLSINWTPFENTIARGLGFYAVAGRGFRSPSVFEARSSDEPTCRRRGRRTTCSVRRANPNLKGETSKSWELGTRFQRNGIFQSDDQLDLQITYIKNKAKDYISSQVIDSYTTGSGRSRQRVDVSQYRNVDKAEIDGFEVSLNYTNERWFSALSAQNLDGKYKSGVNDGRKLPEISPATTNFTIGAYLFEGRSRVGLDVSRRATRRFFQRRVTRVRKGYTIYDVFASYQISPKLTAQLRVENLFDKLYSKRAVVKIDGEDTTTYAPGRNIKLTLDYNL